jgi:hypothetical membrane protein
MTVMTSSPARPTPASATWARAAVLGGVVGPAAFIAAWGLLGATRAGYEPTSRYISDLAAIGAPTRPWMTAGLVVYGLGLPLYGLAARVYGRRGIGSLAIVTGLSTLGVAAFPLGSGSSQGHVIAAAIGYATLAAIPVVGAVRLARCGRFGWAVLSAAVGLASAAALVVTTKGAHAGLWQRTGLTLSDVWVAGHAIALFRSERPGRNQTVDRAV